MSVPAESSSLAVCEYGYWGVNLMTFYPFYPAFYPAKVLDIFDSNRTTGMGGECRMANVAVATSTLPVPHQHFALLTLLATPTLTCWLIILCSGHNNFGNHPPPMTTGIK